jgi:hypothetical protein
VLAEVLNSIEQSRGCIPKGVARTRIALTLASGDHLEIEIDGAAAGEAEASHRKVDPAHLDEFGRYAELRILKGIDDLDLNTSAKEAAKALLAKFPNDVKFTSGRRSISEQASAMAPNVVRNRRWIQQTYKDTPQRAALQKWVDDHPEAKTASAIAAGLEGVMNGWSDDEKRNFSRHITGDAFDVKPVTGSKGDRIKEEIPRLPELHWHTFSEGGLEIWHAQFKT